MSFLIFLRSMAPPAASGGYDRPRAASHSEADWSACR